MEKFTFDYKFQEEILRFVLNNSDGYKAFDFIDHRYFSILEYSIVFYAIERFYKNNKHVPSLPFLRQGLNRVFSDPKFAESLLEEDRTSILNLADTLFDRPAYDGKLLMEEIIKFSSYVDLKDTLSRFHLENFEEYPFFAEKVVKAISKKDQLEQNRGLYLIDEIKERQLSRQATDLIIPSPFYQLNSLTSAGGFSPGGIMVLLDQPKRLKTLTLVNIARRYLARKKKVFYVDLENGSLEIVTRLEQSIGRVTKKEIIKGTKDKEIQKVLRRYKRIGGEFYVKRFPAGSTTLDLQSEMDRVYREKGFKFDILIIDYLGKMGSLSGKREDFNRISDAYDDVANLALENNLEIIWTAHHVQREAQKRERTRYLGTDIAKSIDIVRSAQGIFGLNRSIEEEENGIVRLEIVEGRETLPRGRAYFRVDPATQRLDELTKKEITELEAQGILYNPDGVKEVKERSSLPENGDI